MTSPTYRQVPAQVDLPALEHAVLDFWREQKIFAKSLEQSEGRPEGDGRFGPHQEERDEREQRGRELLLAATPLTIAAADPLHVMPRHLPANSLPARRTLVVGAGKAAAAMALPVENHWPKNAVLDGIVLTRYGHGLPLEKIAVVEAGHPLPDEQGENGARTLLAEVKKLGPDDLLLCLLSGGGSSLLSLPITGISLSDLRVVTRQLLGCGATIQEINTVRKHLSAVQGGRLSASCRAPILALIISDVTGDDPTHIASGPCAPDPTTYLDALAIIEGYGIHPPGAITDTLLAGARGQLKETPKPGDAVFSQVENRVIATAHVSLLAAAEYFHTQDIPAVILGDSVTGEARDVAKVYAALAKEVRQYGHPWKPPVALISGGETTVTLHAKGPKERSGSNGRSGRGGRGWTGGLERGRRQRCSGCSATGWTRRRRAGS